MWHDNETTVDYVNFRIVAKACAELIRGAGEEPVSIGISGGWGVGKSSLVRMVESELQVEDARKSKHVLVTFNPWLYQGFEDARTALLQIVGDAVLKQAQSSATLVKKAEGLIKRINFLRLAQLGGEVAATLITGVPVGLIGKSLMALGDAVGDRSVGDGAEAAKAMPDAAKGLFNDAKPLSLPQEIQAFRTSLEELLKELEITLVVFVDDLDRCLPKTTIATLEAIRLLLFLRRSAFVLAADDTFIRGAVRVHFAGTGISDDIATNYFDKLIQVPLRVPRLGANETKAYTALLFLERAKREGKIDDTHFEESKSKVEQRLRETWKGKSVDLIFLESLVPSGNVELLSLMGLSERLAPLLLTSSAVQSNPRLIKRFLNTVFLRKALAAPQGIDVDVPVLAKWHLLERCDETLANAISESVSAQSDGRVAMLRDAEEEAKNPDTKLTAPFGEKPFAREWLQLEPAFADLDMRPLLHLSRDSTVRDYGSDDLSAEGKVLRDSLAAARSQTEALKEKIRAVGDVQAALAMTRAWEQKRAGRTWQKAEDVLMLTEVCSIFPTAGARAAALLAQAAAVQLSPGLAHALVTCAWAQESLDRWLADPNTPENVKRAIKQGRQN
jgi:predicted KAP-like P-loop ATPase